MKILFLPNWTVKNLDNDNEDIQAPDKNVEGIKYWFFRYFPENTDVEIIDICKNNWLHSIEKTIKFYIYQAIIAYKIQNKYDIIISHGAQSGIVLSLLRLLFGKGKAKHLIFDIGGMNGGRNEGLSTKLIQIAVKSKPYIIAHSSIIIDNINKIYPILNKRVRFIPFGIGLYQYKINCKVTLNDSIFVFAGHNRDTDTVYKAWNELTAEHKTGNHIIKFIGVTDDKYKGENILCIHKLPYDQYIKELESSLFVILPLPAKRFSYGQMSLLGSLALGKHVIVNNVYGVKDYIKKNEFIMSINPYNVQDMKNAITKMVSIDIKDLTNIYKPRKYVADFFSEKRMSNAIYKYINEILKK